MILQISFSRYFGPDWLCPRKLIASTCRKNCYLSVCKNQLHCSLLSWNIAKILQICYFRYLDKPGHLVEYSLRNIFLENHTQNVVEKLFPDPFLKNQNWANLCVNSLKFYSVCFYCMLSWGLSKYIEINCKPLTFTSHKAFLKNKKRSGTSLPASFSAWLFKKNIYLVIFYSLIKFDCLVAFTSWEIGKYVHCNCLPSCEILIFEINLVFLIKPFFPDDHKVKKNI